MILFSVTGGVGRDMSGPAPSPRGTLESPQVSTVNNGEHERRDVRNTAVLWGMCLTGVSSYYGLLHPLNLPWPAPQRPRAGRAHRTCRQDSESLADRRRPPRDAQVAFLCASGLLQTFENTWPEYGALKDPRKSFTGHLLSVVRFLVKSSVGFHLNIFFFISRQIWMGQKYCLMLEYLYCN